MSIYELNEKIKVRDCKKGLMKEHMEDLHEGIGNMLSNGMKRKSIYKKD